MQENQIPKIFISYSWNTEKFVSDLANRLGADGVDVVWDKWDLKPGQDIYKFMEKSVNDPDITKVLLICDKTYRDKANSRIGGVGTETLIISSEIYQKVEQEKFIPLIIEKDEENEPFIPTFIKSRLFIDFSDSDKYEESYEELIRYIYGKPKYSKPKLGKRPDWLDEDKGNYFPLKDLIKQIKGSNNDKKKSSCIAKFETNYIEALKEFYIKNITPQQAYDNFCKMKPVRDVYLDFLLILYEETNDFSDIICQFFENLYNKVTCAFTFEKNPSCCNPDDFDVYHILIWELFICTIAYLRHISDYQSINLILKYTYFLDLSNFGKGNKLPKNYYCFMYYSRLIEEKYKSTTEHKRLFTLLGDEIFKSREKLPCFSRKAITEADLFLYQVGSAFNFRYNMTGLWFPRMYIYVENSLDEWERMKSEHFCKKNIFSLFGVSSIKELKECIAHCKSNNNIYYSDSFDIAPVILDSISLDDIGSYN